MEEHSILDLIENNTYHSCVILGYSFDPIFFDEIIYPKLKKVGIVNILVFIDSMMLEQSLEKMITHEFCKSEGYSISSLKAKTAFHPKLLLLLGEKASRTLIGSGNPTFGGYSRNQELWFSFRTSAEDIEGEHILRDVWDYINEVTSQNRGIVQKKLKMAEAHAPWLKEVQAIKGKFVPIDVRQQIAVLRNDTSGIYAKLLKEIRDERIQHINVHSPFFDGQFALLKAFSDDLSPKRINVFIQPQYVMMPANRATRLPKNIRFFNTENLFKQQGKSSQRYIHAKLYEFVGKKSSYILFGSPNLSFAAMGNKKTAGPNEELALLLKNDARIHYFEMLGFSHDKTEEIERSTLVEIVNISKELSEQKTSGKAFNITSIDEDRGIYEVYTSNETDNVPSGLVIQDVNGEVISKISNYSSKQLGKFVFKNAIRLAENGAIGFLSDESGERISNRSIINSIKQLAKSNPSQRYKDIQVALSAIELESEQLWRLFSLIDPAEFMVKSKSISQRKKRESEGTEQENEEILTYEDFVKIEEELEKRNGLDYLTGRSSLSEIIDVMSRWVRKIGYQYENKRADVEETENIEQSEGAATTAEENFQDTAYAVDWITTQRKKANRYFKKYRDILSERYESNESFPHHLFGIHAISTYLLLYSALKQYKTAETEELKSIIPLIDSEDVEDLLNYSIDLNGLIYSRLLRDNYYDAEVVKFDKNLHREITQSAYNGITLICMAASMELPEDEFYNFVKTSCLLIFLNIMDITEKNSVKIKKGNISQHVLSFANVASENIDMAKVESRLEEFWNVYKKIKIGKEPLKYSEIEKNKIYYSTRYGFLKIAEVQPRGQDKVKLNFSMPGIDWDEEVDDYVFSIAYYCPPANLYQVSGLP